MEACPYISQDRLVMACATASLWMSSNALATKVGLPIYTTSEITAMALSLQGLYGPSLVSRGLTVTEEERAFVSMGYDPRLWEFPSATSLINVCYAYTESGIPLVLNVNFPGRGNHALTVVGHLMDLGYRRNSPLFARYPFYSASEFVPSFVVNDDQSGIYLRAEIQEVPKGRCLIKKDKDPLMSRFQAEIKVWTGQKALVGYCYSLVVPFPPRVSLSADYPLFATSYWLRQFINRKRIENKPLVLRPYLIRSNMFKQSCLGRRNSLPGLEQVYRSMCLPRHIWVVEYGYLNDWVKSNFSSLMVQGEFIFDATLAPELQPGEIQAGIVQPDFLCGHIQGGILAQQIKDEKLHRVSFPLPNDSPYSCCTEPESRP